MSDDARRPAEHASACCAPGGSGASPAPDAPAAVARPRSTRGQVLLPGGRFAMGDAFGEGYASDGETPVHEVRLEPFWMDATAVTNASFAAFVKDSGHVTDAEELGVSAVFHLAFRGERSDVLQEVAEAPWWWAVRGASWRHPGGPATSIQDRQNHPVVHVTWRDAAAYAAWAGKRLPTEAEWEHAARGGLEGRRFAWGDELTPRGRWQCNIWQGDFPRSNTEEDGHLTTAPVKTYRPNGHGLWQMAGNVWEWCADWFDPGYYATSPVDDPRGPDTGTARVMRGGSYLCHHSYCHRYRVAARSSNTPDSASGNTGFRCANDA
ncbi:formylglycine-generating enzyme family protein [Nocardioides currus]|uniref:Sulfatase modifying factor 1 (C-alpha-formyglycine-generating enzyme 1) n=1 Tax=Nocardioides currus TaxID=2133958 RepID=A0A2R7YUT5_9ACTN|nr:formylglycine-generating enzyme family protein [Nocardioides currus]PUA80128.1 sulfatase modifying factor 1 (C-alpha-formyglycine- generating enzyme 1) [Nocardioides currus]